MTAGEGGPFGALIVKDRVVVGRGWNRVTSSNDPTAHAEVEAIRNACSNLGTFSLEGCEIYASCEPCPMCLAAMYWARLEAVYFAATRDDAAEAGFDDAFIYSEIETPRNLRELHSEVHLQSEGRDPLCQWAQKNDRIPY